MLNCRFALLAICIAVSTFVSLPLKKCNAQLTPLRFAQRADVSNEIQISPQQSELIRQLEQNCGPACQQRLQQTLAAMGGQERDLFESLSADDQQQFGEILNTDVRETMELEMLDQQILNSSQMNRFNQLWLQTLGLDAFTSGPTSRLLDISPTQMDQIQIFQNNGNQLIDACLANPNLSDSQKNAFITNINNIVIDQSVNILNNFQIENFIVNSGEPFEFAPDVDPDADTGPVALEPNGIDAILDDPDQIGSIQPGPARNATAQQNAQSQTGQNQGSATRAQNTAGQQNTIRNNRIPTAARTNSRTRTGGARQATSNRRATSNSRRQTTRSPQRSRANSRSNSNSRSQSGSGTR